MRNPIFTGLMLTLAGAALISPSAWTVMGLLVAVILIMLQARLEEVHLLDLHGAGYARYASRVGRFVPGIGRLARCAEADDGGEEETMGDRGKRDRPMPGIAFQVMSAMLRTRDLFLKPREIVREAGVTAGHHVLDFGCGPGNYAVAAAEAVGAGGRVLAVDIHPMAVRRVEAMAERRGLAQLEAIRSDGATGLPDGSVDVVLLYDIFHMLSRPDEVLAELHRVLKPDGVLSFSCHHMKHDAIVEGVTGLFRLEEKAKKTYTFRPRNDPAGPVGN